ncbi:MAG: N-acetyltransferase [Chloroflexota bacterium]
MLNYHIEAAGLSDLGELHRLEKEIFALDAWPWIDLFLILVMPGFIRLKAVVEGRIVGFIAADMRRSAGIGWIVTLGVRETHRRHGIGQALLLRCEELMKTRLVRLSVRKSNRGAILLYQQTGYHLLDTWSNYYSGGEDALVFEKAILPKNHP